MANAGKKRASTSTPSASAGKKLKLANKQASSKHKGKAPSRLASKQKSVDEYSTFSKPEDGRKGSKAVSASAAAEDGAPKLLRDKKGKATIKEFVELPEHLQKLKDRKARREGSESDEDESEHDIEDLGVEDMLAAADSDDDEEAGVAGPSSKQDFAARARFLSKLDVNELARYATAVCHDWRPFH